MLQVNLQFTENALPVVVEEGIAKSSGARCSRSILESIVTEAMFEVESDDLTAYGLIPEFVARLPVLVSCIPSIRISLCSQLNCNCFLLLVETRDNIIFGGPQKW
ncbi:uncharacterized protein [Solanum lycopersicum]|uniref:uncharacterized protein isoform X1 n=1 Tax=Solanum lycopersicum TaxID=4081 RepID=UPI0037498147